MPAIFRVAHNMEHDSPTAVGNLLEIIILSHFGDSVSVRGYNLTVITPP